MGSDAVAGNTRQDRAIDAIWREHRPLLIDLAFRMLGNIGDAEDTVQDAFVRLLRADLNSIEEIKGWLVVVVSRLCLDQLRSARARRDGHLDESDAEQASTALAVPDAADRVTLDDDVRVALLIVLEQLSPAERTAFVLHDIFQFSFADVAAVVGRSPAACRKLASRARRHVASHTNPARFAVEPADQHQVTERFIAVCAGGDVSMLMELLDPDVVGHATFGPGGPTGRPQHGARRVAKNLAMYFGGPAGVTLVSYPVDGKPGLLAFRNRELAGIVVLKFRGGRIFDIHVNADPRLFASLSLKVRGGLNVQR